MVKSLKNAIAKSQRNCGLQFNIHIELMFLSITVKMPKLLSFSVPMMLRIIHKSNDFCAKNLLKYQYDRNNLIFLLLSELSEAYNG